MKIEQNELVEKLQKQNELTGGNSLGEINVTMNNSGIEQESVQQPPNPSDFFKTSTMEQQPQQVVETGLPKIKGVREEIEEVQQALGKVSVDKTKSNLTAEASKYLDDLGDLTYFIENLSDSHLVISDLDITIKRGSCEDLLEFALLEELKKSRELRTLLSDVGVQKFLRRLTPEEFLLKKQMELKNKEIVTNMKANQAAISQQANQQMAQNPQVQAQQPQKTSRIRPTVLSKLEKLRLATVPQHAHLGITSIEFIEWAVTENLNNEELEYITAHPNVVQNNEIRTALFKKMGTRR